MRSPIHTRFLNSDYARFQTFYQANSSKFRRKEIVRRVNSEKVTYVCLETSDGYLVYRDGAHMRVASPSEVHNNQTFLENSEKLYQELHPNTDKTTQHSPTIKKRKVTHSHPEKSTSTQFPPTPPSSVPVSPEPDEEYSHHTLSGKPSSGFFPTPPSTVPATPEPDQEILQSTGSQMLEQSIANGILNIVGNGEYTAKHMQYFMRECSRLVRNYDDGTEGGDKRARLLVYGALIASGKGITWPAPVGSEDKDFRFDRLAINFSELNSSGADDRNPDASLEDIITSRFVAARRELKKHDLFLHTPPVSPEQRQMNMARREVQAMNRYILKYYEDENPANLLWELCDQPDGFSPFSMKDLLSGELCPQDMKDPRSLPEQTLQIICNTSKALKMKAKQDSDKTTDLPLKKRQPPYHPRYTEDQMKNPAFSERRGNSLFDRLHDHASIKGVPDGIWDSPFTQEDVKAFRDYYYSTFPQIN